MFVALAILIVLGAVIGWERYRGGGAAAPPGRSGGFRPTTEVFIDPENGQRMRVWLTTGPGSGVPPRVGEEDASRAASLDLQVGRG